MPITRVALAFFVAGCASNPGASSSPGPTRVVATDETYGITVRSTNDAGPSMVTLQAPFSEVMSAIRSAYAFLNIPVTLDNESTGEQGNRQFLMSRTFDRRPVSDYLNCGDDPFGGPNANSNTVTVSLVTRARAIDATHTLLETAISGVTYKTSNTGAIYCASTGALEHHIAEMVASRAKQ